MSRRGSGGASIGGATGTSGAASAGQSARERTHTGGSGGPRDGSPSALEKAAAREIAAANTNAAATAPPQFLSIRSRVGKRYQAALPELREKPSLTDPDRATKLLKVMHLSKSRYSLDRANALGTDLDKYLKMARALRDGSTFDTEEQITCLALEYLHRFDYNTTDAACSLYARHSMEVPKQLGGGPSDASSTGTRSNNPAEIEAKWLGSFYRLMRLPSIGMDEYKLMGELLTRAAASGIAATELGVLERLLKRLTQWLTASEDMGKRDVDRADLQRLVHDAEDLMLDVPEKHALEQRLRAFDLAYGRLKDAIERTNRRNQAKCQLDELEELFRAVIAVRVHFPEQPEFTTMLAETRQLKQTITAMLAEDKVSLAAMRDVIARIELVPVNFESEVEQFQQKMLNAQSWLAKVRKCIPKRRGSRRGGGPEPKKVDLDAIRALVDDAPCEDTAEAYEIQDLLECADEWAEKVRTAIDGGADVTLAQLQELLDEGNAMPVEMDEQRFLEAEIQAREWCTRAGEMLASKKPFRELETMMDTAKTIRQQLHAKKQSRWKPQIERDIQAALDTARRWIHEVRDALGAVAFDKLYGASVAGGSSHGASAVTSAEDAAAASTATQSEATAAFVKGKKSVDVVHRLLEKAARLVVNVGAYTAKLDEVLAHTALAQRETKDMLAKIGVEGGEESPSKGDFGAACGLLDRVAALPLVFDEGVVLFEIVHREKDWAQRVRDAIPPRQSRKKRQSKHATTLADLTALLEEAQSLRFQFNEEIKILTKELEDMGAWQRKAVEVVAARAEELAATAAKQLEQHDLAVLARVNEAKKQLTPAEETVEKEESGGEEKTEDEDVKMEEEAPALVLPTAEAASPSSVAVAAAVASAPPPLPVVNESFSVDAIVHTIRVEAGCTRKANNSSATETNGETEGEEGDDSKKATLARGLTVLEPLLVFVEESLVAVSAVEVKEDLSKQLEELLASSAAPPPPDEAVHQLDAWRDAIGAVLDEGALFNAVSPEQEALGVVVELLAWLPSARSVFYHEPLPLDELVSTGRSLAAKLPQLTVWGEATRVALASLLWPLPFLEQQHAVVAAWAARVGKTLEDKHASLEAVQSLLREASALLLAPEAVRVVLDELKKAKLWLAKLKKRLKSLLAKHVTRLTLAVAKALVDEGDEIALELPALELLKEHVELASDWERRVLASGLESGHAKIATLVALLAEYDAARLVIDLDMHRDVLTSATERYCVCRQPYDGFMIGCDQCDDWFHDNCIGLSKEKAEKVEQYTCPSCTILVELARALQRAVDGQARLWGGDTDYGKSYEKQHAATQRKIKREEKAVERSEMLLFSCNNHMNQLRARIEDMERAKAALSGIKPPPFEDAAVTGNAGSDSAKSSLAVTLPLNASVASALVAASASSSASGSTTAIPNVPMDTLAFVQRYPNILLPSAKPLPTARASEGGDATSQPQLPPQGEAATDPPAAVAPPNMLAPMLAKLSENTERLSALLVAGGVEQQLAKMKNEHAEVQAQVHELQTMIRVSKERVAGAQASLDELKRAFVIRQHGLPRAKAWIQRVVRLLNTPATLARHKFQDDDCFLSTELLDVLTDAKAQEIDHFPEIQTYTQLVRAAGWSLVTVAMLQERPSREALMKAIVYANEHFVLDPLQAVAPLRAIIGRVDVWIAKAHKTLGAPPNAQKAARLKALMNEYSKLPLTCAWVSALDEYARAVEAGNGDDLEPAAVAAVAAASTAWLPAPNPNKAPRKRKPYTKRDSKGEAEDKGKKKAKTAKQPKASGCIQVHRYDSSFVDVDGEAAEDEDGDVAMGEAPV